VLGTRGATLLLLLLSLVVPSGTLAGSGSESPAASQERTIVIQGFDVTLEVGEDGGLEVQEHLELRFSGSWNGIVRAIPFRYRNRAGMDYRLDLRVQEVADADGAALRWEESRAGFNREIRIWVPGASDAVRTVILRYHVGNALRFFEEHDELYWNVTGDEWPYPIERASAVVRLPSGATGRRSNVFTGPFGATGRDAAVQDTPDGFLFETTRELGIREGMTVAVAWNPGAVRRPTGLGRVWAFLRANWLLGFPVLSLMVMFGLWRARGKDPELRPVAPAYAPPKGMRPAEVGTLIDNRPDMRDITASIVDLAVRGYLRIEEVGVSRLRRVFRGEDYRLIRLDPPEGEVGLHPHEKRLLEGLFARRKSEVLVSELEDNFYTHLQGIRDGIFEHLLERGYYHHRPDRVLAAYVGIGIVVSFAGAVGMAILADLLYLSIVTGLVAGLLTGLPIIGFGLVMPARTVAGARKLEEILGFREFLDRVEEARFRRMITSPEQFERYLPYAMALGVDRKWARAFDGIYQQNPSWYVGSTPGAPFATTRFVGNLGSMTSRASSAMRSQPRSSGGSGFSGGSGGGGGGSSGGGFGGGGGRGF